MALQHVGAGSAEGGRLYKFLPRMGLLLFNHVIDKSAFSWFLCSLQSIAAGLWYYGRAG